MKINPNKRLYQRNHPAMPAANVEDEFNRQLGAVSVVINADYLQSDRNQANQSLFQNEAKVMLHPPLTQLGLDKWDVIAEITEEEIIEDVKTMVNEIVVFCR